MLLGESGILNLASERLEDGLKVRIYDKWCFCTILVIIEFNLGLVGAWNREHVKHRHKVVTCVKLFVASRNFLR